MKCKIDHSEDGMIPQFLCLTCNPRKIGSNGGPMLVAEWVDPVAARQQELRAAQAEAVKAKRAAALEKHKQNIADRHPGEEWNRKKKMWIRTERSMAKYEAKLQAEFAAAEKEAA